MTPLRSDRLKSQQQHHQQQNQHNITLSVNFKLKINKQNPQIELIKGVKVKR